MNNSTATEQVFKATEKLPEPYEPVIAICKTYRFLGYIDSFGKWRTQHGGEEVLDVIAWCCWR